MRKVYPNTDERRHTQREDETTRWPEYSSERLYKTTERILGIIKQSEILPLDVVAAMAREEGKQLFSGMAITKVRDVPFVQDGITRVAADEQPQFLYVLDGSLKRALVDIPEGVPIWKPQLFERLYRNVKRDVDPEVAIEALAADERHVRETYGVPVERFRGIVLTL